MRNHLVKSAARSLRVLTSRIRCDASRRFQIMSDLHLEIGQQYSSFDFPVTAPFLILAGDIGRLVDYDGYLTFLRRQTLRYDRIFLVLGNHEFYGMDYQTGLERARQMTDEPSLQGRTTLLQQNRYEMVEGSDLVILGCILWSQIPQESSGAIASVVSDFKQIKGWTIAAHNDAHLADLSWLREEIELIQREMERQPRAVIVVTHHAPMIARTASPKHDESAVKSAFATDICNAGDWNAVRYWIFGHTHWTTNTTSHGVKLVSNQRGYVFPGNVGLVADSLPNKHTFDASRTIQL